MRVLEITGEPILHGGQERFIQNLVDNMNNSDIRIDVLTPYSVDNAAFCETVEKRGGKVYSLGLNFQPGRSRRNLKKAIPSFFEDKTYNVIHIHSGSISALLYIAKASVDSGARKVIAHSHATAEQSLKHSVIRQLYGRQLEKIVTNCFACSSNAAKDKFPKKSSKNEVAIIPNGINPTLYVRNDTKRKNIRETLGIGEAEKVIGSVGRFSHEKNFEFLIRAFYDANRGNSKLLLIGDGELKPVCEGLVKELGIEEKVIFTGNVDNVNDYYQGMDLFMLASLHEGLPFVTLEAQAAGLPGVVSTGIPADALLCSNFKRIDLADRENWISIIREKTENCITDNSQIIKEMGYDISNTVKIVADIYKQGV